MIPDSCEVKGGLFPVGRAHFVVQVWLDCRFEFIVLSTDNLHFDPEFIQRFFEKGVFGIQSSKIEHPNRIQYQAICHGGKVIRFLRWLSTSA